MNTPAPQKRPVRRRNYGQSSSIMPLLIVLILILAVFQWQVAALIAIFLLPTFVLAITEKSASYADKLFCVAFMNLSGIAPFAMQVWERPGSFARVASDVINVVVMLGSAAVGYVLLWVGPIIAATFLQAMAQDKLKNIASQRQSIIDAWGSEVAENVKKEESNFIKRK